MTSNGSRLYRELHAFATEDCCCEATGWFHLKTQTSDFKPFCEHSHFLPSPVKGQDHYLMLTTTGGV